MTREFTHEICSRLEENLPRLDKCLLQLDEKQIWWRPNENSNSIANLILHVNGNITQYILAGLGNEKDLRERDKEFKANKAFSKQELQQLTESTIQKAKSIINSLSQEQLTKEYLIQGFSLNGISACVHVTEHLSYHVGQIALLTKIIKNLDLGFYAGFDLNITD